MVSAFFVLLFQASFLHAAPSVALGKDYFKNNCASCHNKNMKDNLTGPALGGTVERWASYPREDLYSWIRNSQAMIKKGHPKAVELWEKWKPAVMTNFPNATDEEIESVLMYIDDVLKGPGPGAGGKTGEVVSVKEKSGISYWYYIVLAFLITLALLLWNITNNLSRSQQLAKGDAEVEVKSVWEILTGKAAVSFILFGLVLFGGYTTVNNAISMGRQQNYAPDQPIKFSHETHSGLHKIDCNYCHDGARRSKQSVIPSTNTCMNCHTAIKNGSKYGTAEITKIFVSIGFNPSTDKYIPNYEDLSNEEVGDIYKKWIAESYQKANNLPAVNEAAQMEAELQWQEILASLTSEAKPKVQGPIEWKRIHNLPDHVYFNHAQHVTVGKIACQTCHGKVENMPVLKQYSTLSMGWCINCHRQTDVAFQDNKYYESYKAYHAELKSGNRNSVKVADIGGLECQKCHY